MKPSPFDYLRAATLPEALEALGEDGARVLAGGQTLLPMLNMRLARPALLVDVMHIPALHAVTDDGRTLRIGAAVRQAALEGRPGLAHTQPLLAAALPWVGHAQTRSRGTLCGSVAHADPSAEIPLVLLAMRGTVHLRSRRASARSVAAEAFFTGLMATARAEDEMIEAITLPHAVPGAGHAFREVGRRHGDFAIAALAAVVEVGGGTRLAVGGVADRPVMRALPSPEDPALDKALAELAWSLEARDDLHATASYRRHLVRSLGRSVIEEAGRCRSG